MKSYLNKHEILENGCDESCSCLSNEEKFKNLTEIPKLKISELQREDSILGDAFLSSGEELCLRNLSVNFKLARFTTENGRRHSVYHEYLRRTFDYENLKILMKSRVLKVKFNVNKEAKSLLVSSAGQVARIHVKNEIILSAGAIQSPQLLLLSGIGDKNDLKKAGINLVHHSPNVGKNLFDHMNFPLFLTINQSACINVEKILSAKEILKYVREGSGVWSNTAVIGLGSSGDCGIILFGMGSADEAVFRKMANFKKEVHGLA